MATTGMPEFNTTMDLARACGIELDSDRDTLYLARP
jgi:DNA-binding phage protein